MSQKIALVTGASRGIGRAIAVLLGQQGFTVVGTATSETGAAGISAALAEAGVMGEGAVLNLTDQTQMDALLSHIESTFGGGPDVLVNNAGIRHDNLLVRMKEEEWDAVLNTNLKAVFKLTRACCKSMMKKRWGRVINISSVVATMGNPGQSNYAAAKAGLIGFAKSAAMEVATRGITMNVVSPGFIQTDMTDSLTDDQKAAIYSKIPMQKMGSAEDIAAAVGFLASDGAAYITGQTIHVNGGMLMV